MANESVTEQANDLATAEDFAAVSFEALLSDGDLQELERTANSFAPNRRALQVLLARGKRDLLERAKDDIEGAANIYLDLLDYAKDYREFLKTQGEQIDAAEARILSLLGSLVERIETEAQPA
ncbi:MAG: hypothetical protein NVV60_00630 [Luteimonas sp.]|nr:hypothetical protein [Luteimonas sp.]